MTVSRKPLIGVTPLWDDKLESLWMLPGYFDGITEAGGVPVMLPLADDESGLEQLISTLDGVLITGGHDVGPELYGEEPGPKTIELCPARDRMEMRLIPTALRQGKPLLGICRGIQSLNVALGGTLWQDLPSQHPGGVEHHGKPPYDQPVHTVRVDPHSPLASALWPTGDDSPNAGADNRDRFNQFHPAPYTLAVNSFHHQAIHRLADPLSPMAIAPDGVIEAVHMPGKRFVWAVQWHPEFAHKVDANQRAIFREFVTAASR